MRGRVVRSEPPKPGRSTARHGRCVDEASWAQPSESSSRPWSRTSGRPVPGHDRTLRRRPSGSSRSRRAGARIPRGSSTFANAFLSPPAGGRGDGGAALPGAAAALRAGGGALGLGLGGRVLLALLVRHLANDQTARLDLLVDEVELLLALVGVPLALCLGRHTSLRVPGAPGVLSRTRATAPARARKAPLSGSFPRQSVRQTRRRSVSRAVVSSRA